MNYPVFFEPKNSLRLFGLQDKLNFLKHLYSKKNLPNVLLFSGNKGSGKSTLVNHFLYSIFDSLNYDIKNFCLSDNTTFHNQFKNNIFSNIIYLNGSNFKSIKVDDIRNLKTKIFQSTIFEKDRFIILDDIELFNHNSLNALLKIIEEPSKNNYFFLINNKSKPLLQTIKSRALEMKIFLKENQRIEIIEKLIKLFKIELILDPKTSKLSPGNFLRFNHICKDNNIHLTNDLVENLSIILQLYKKDKDISYINLAFFLSDCYFINLSDKSIFNNNEIYEIKSYVFQNLNNFKLYNINQNTLLNALSEKLNYG